ncbi:hypothetical protein B4U80_10890 [Leptotrombidium deliense]|uniref:Uncharacterized protein n=1 Tax=Leptotrombidium deliense TaxID=299467 RepID=A0A443RY21_9ACAR|nr:hypothetical protein B4U80_10890 [Leptotrombidium deliense]
MLILQHPYTAIISGPTGCGKSQWVLELLKNIPQTTFDQVIYFYSIEQCLFYEMKKYSPKMIFSNDIQNMALDSFDGRKTLIILDDMMAEASENRFICDLFTKGSHHKNISVILILQNFFYKGKLMRTISLNAHYIVLFKNPRDKSIINYIGRQICPEKYKCFKEAFDDATRKPYGYLFIDLKPNTDDRLRYLTNVFTEKAKRVIVYRCD